LTEFFLPCIQHHAQVVTSIAAVIERVGGQEKGGTQTAIEASGSEQILSAGSKISADNAPMDTVAPRHPPPLQEVTENESDNALLDAAKLLS